MNADDLIARAKPSPLPSPEGRGGNAPSPRLQGEGIVPSPAEPVPDEFDLVCENCGYSLIGLRGNVCPECGEEFDPAELPLARVPWLWRKRTGYLSAYV